MKSKNKIWKNTFESQLSWTKLREGSSCPNALLSIWYKINQYLENPECKAVCLFVDCKTSVFFSKSVKKSVKRGVRVLRARSARASHAPQACEAREEPTVRFPYNEFVPTRGFKNVVELSKFCSQLHPLCVFDTLGDWFRGRIAHFSSNLDAVSSNSKAVFSVASQWNVVYIVKYSIYSGGSKISIFSVSSQSCPLFSASFHTFCLTVRAYLNMQKYGLFCSLLLFNPYAQLSEGQSAKRSEE